MLRRLWRSLSFRLLAIFLVLGGLFVYGTFKSIQNFYNSDEIRGLISDRWPLERFQIIFPEDGTEFDFQGIWNSISKVRIVGEYLQSGKNIGVFLYQRSVGAGNPEEWSWYVVMNR